MKGLSAAYSAVNLWRKSKAKNNEGVLVLPEEEELPIYALKPDVTFTCIGKPEEPPRET